MGFSWQVYWSSLPFPPSVDHVFFKNLHYDPFILGSPACRAWLIASLSYAIPFATTRQWSMKGTINKAEHPKIDTFKLWCWRRLLRVPWTARKSNQSILKEINPEYWLEGLVQKLRLQTLATWCEEPTYWKRPWCWERLRAGGEVGNRGRDGWMTSLTQWTWVWANSGREWKTGEPGVLQSMGWQRVRHDLVTEQQ